LRWRQPLPACLAVLGVALAGEMLDALDDVASLGHWRWQASLHDLVVTLFWPAILMVVCWRLRAERADRRPRSSRQD
jgi:hypothetical protein